jgi:hypothetical protein
MIKRLNCLKITGCCFGLKPVPTGFRKPCQGFNVELHAARVERKSFFAGGKALAKRLGAEDG